tara:strand:- start:49 stop:405 length:357 start_codon:yes stop_codon:yes gene_type:complete
MITINFTGNINNDSLQIGDMAYFITPSSLGGFNQSTNTPILIGSIEAITVNSIDVDETIQTITPPLFPGANDFIMFAKDSRINLSGLVGYYAEIEMKNNSNKEIEMFSIGSEITLSSK